MTTSCLVNQCARKGGLASQVHRAEAPSVLGGRLAQAASKRREIGRQGTSQNGAIAVKNARV